MKSVVEKVWALIEKICYVTLSGLWKVRKKEMPEELFLAFMQFIKFGIVGVSNTVIGYLLNVGTLLILSKFSVGWDYIAGNLVSFFLSVLWSFYWNNKYVFAIEEGKKRNIGKALIKTYLSYGFTGIILNNILSYIWLNFMGISKFVAPMINLLLSVPINFLINKLWAFKGEQEGEK